MSVSRAIIISLLVAVSLVTSTYGWHPSFFDNWSGRRNVSHSLAVGRASNADRLLYHNRVNVPPQWYRQLDHYINYPRHGRSPYTITRIVMTDMTHDGTGGYASIIRGGVGYRYTALHLGSQRGYGLNYNVTIFGN